MGKTSAQKGANVVKDGIRHKDVYATAVGDITKPGQMVTSEKPSVLTIYSHS